MKGEDVLTAGMVLVTTLSAVQLWKMMEHKPDPKGYVVFYDDDFEDAWYKTDVTVSLDD